MVLIGMEIIHLTWLFLLGFSTAMVKPPEEPIVATCPSVCFCDETQYVSCVGDGLWEVPIDIPPTVQRLELRNYVIGTLECGGLLSWLLQLVELKLQQTCVSSIDNSTFGNLTHLMRLDLSENVLERVSSATFEGLASLRYLDLSVNRLSQLDEAFVDLVNLEQLNLRQNQLPQLTSLTFHGLVKLQYLNLDSNQLTAIEVGTFQYMTNLAHLIVSNNPLTTLSRLDFFGSRLQYIDVSKVELRRVPQSLTRYVRDLRLAKNNLTHLRLGDFDSYPYLSLLVLDDNRLEEVESDALGRLEFLMRLWLNGNRLQRIPSNLPPSLHILYVEENLISKLPSNSFQGLYNLEQLFLKRNHIQEIEFGAFSDLVSLTHLDLQANLIQSLQPGCFANLSSLLSLDLSQNPLSVIESSSFMGLESLKTLVLSRIKVSMSVLQWNGTIFDSLSQLESLELYDSPALAATLVNSSRAMRGLRNLRELNLMHNNLHYLRADFPHFFPQLRVVKLSGNQWNCQPDLLWLSTWLTKSDTHFHHSYGIRCSQPLSLLSKPIAMLKKEDFYPSTIQIETTTTSTPTTVTDIKASTNITTSTTIQIISTLKTTVQPYTYSNPTFSSTESQELLNLTDWNTDTTVTSENTFTTENSTWTEGTDDKSWTNKSGSSWSLAPSSETPIKFYHPTIEHQPNDESLVAAISISTGFGLLLMGVVIVFLLFRCQKSQNMLSCMMRRSSSSISYSPHRDEVSIVTVSDGTVGLNTLSHQGLSNKLYFVLENNIDPNSRDQVTKAALPDSSLKELLPAEHPGPPPYTIIKSTNTYCFT